MLNSIVDFFGHQRLFFSRFIPYSVRPVAIFALLLALTGSITNSNLANAHTLAGDLAKVSALAGDRHMADPSVIRVGTCYYGFSTGFQGGPGHGSPTIRKTCDTTLRTGWTYVGTVFTNTPAWITAALGSQPPNLWAPDINYWNGKYHLYYAGSLWGTAFAVMGLATATHIQGPWTDAGEVTRVNYPIDPNVAWGPGGVAYITWGSWTGNYGISMHVLDQTTGKLSTSNKTLWHIANGIEATTMSFNGGYYYLWGSKGTCCQGVNSTYYTVVGRSTSITGPFLDKNGTNMNNGGGTTVLTGSWPKVAAGGADEFDDPTYNVAQRLAYHYYDANNNGQETLDIRTITYSNGWPVLSAPL
jgi:arabinan endo-1,5-alpha-L-arabinosidase